MGARREGRLALIPKGSSPRTGLGARAVQREDPLLRGAPRLDSRGRFVPTVLAPIEERHLKLFELVLGAAWMHANPSGSSVSRDLRACAAEIALLRYSPDSSDQRLAALLERDLWPVVAAEESVRADEVLALAMKVGRTFEELAGRLIPKPRPTDRVVEFELFTDPA